MDTIQPISAAEFSAKLVSSLVVLQGMLKPVIFPIAGISATLSIFLMLCGTIFHSKVIKKMGLVDLGATCGAVLLYLAIPLMLGVLKAMGNALN